MERSERPTGRLINIATVTDYRAEAATMAEPISAAEAGAHFLSSLESERARDERPVVERFVAWFGGDRSMTELTGDIVSTYAGQLASLTGVAAAAGEQGAAAAGSGAPAEGDDGDLEPLRGFLAYSSRLAFTGENLVPFLHLEAGGGGARGGAGAIEELGGAAFFVTIEGLEGLEGELVELKGRRPQMAEELRAAMADKDFRENAPLDAARDAQAHLEARIRAVEHQLRHAVIIDASAKGGRANVGSTVKLLNLSVDREQVFELVSPNDVDPANGKISVESPVGKAVINRVSGEEVTVEAPGGAMRFQLLEVID